MRTRRWIFFAVRERFRAKVITCTKDFNIIVFNVLNYSTVIRSVKWIYIYIYTIAVLL